MYKDAPATPPTCGLCGAQMPAGEEMFNYHGYSGPCPTPEADPVLQRLGGTRAKESQPQRLKE